MLTLFVYGVSFGQTSLDAGLSASQRSFRRSPRVKPPSDPVKGAMKDLPKRPEAR